jgi:hypothetical protein
VLKKITLKVQFMKKYIFALMLIASSISSVWAQSSQSVSDKEYMRNPLWIEMMDEASPNFFEVEKAYELYFSKHEKPEGEHDVIGEYAERQKTPSKRKQRKISAENDLRFAVKKYELWHDQTLPYVQPDGRILGTEERLAIWESQKSK